MDSGAGKCIMPIVPSYDLDSSHIKPKQQKPKGIPTKVGNTPKKLMVFLFLAFETKKKVGKNIF